MTNEEKTLEVLHTLDGVSPEQMAEAREAFAKWMRNDWFSFSVGQYCAGPGRRGIATLDLLEKSLGEEAAHAIKWEEFEKFGKTVDPEYWRIYWSGTQEEYDALRDRLQEQVHGPAPAETEITR
jgi:hypothetical protein